MKRIQIVHSGPVSSFNSDWLSGIFNQYLDFTPWDPTVVYSPGTLFYINCLQATTETVTEIQNRGFKPIIDNLWEVDPGPIAGTKRICCPAWFWYNESMWYQHLGYNQYRPRRSVEYQALMPMNLVKPHRTDFVKAVEHLLDNMMWSYVGTGRQLPNDGDMTDWNTQRRFNAEWYDQTYLSMVVETLVRRGSKHTPIFITEKTMKPLAFEHPLIVYGNRGTLRQLRSWGFATFDNLWDESYDETVNQEQRCADIVKLLETIKIQSHDPETLRRLEHNRNHFYNREIVIDRVVKEIIEPIIEYAETR